MSIEIVGPNKYKFQDRVCAILAILHADDPAVHLEIEPRGGEDAQLIFDLGSSQRIVEVQIKGGKGKVDAEALADWLSHFPARRTGNPLIERLINDSTRTVLMIASGRCDDATSTYVVQFAASVEARARGAIKLADEVAIRSAFELFAQQRPKDRAVKQKQRAYIRSFLPGVRKKSLREAMHRVLVVERLDEIAVRQKGEDLLHSMHRVVPDRVNATLSKLETIVSEAKGTGCDILPMVRTAILAAQPNDPLSPTGYIRRGDEDLLKKRLETEKVLLLAGRPRIGKTTTSRWLAAEVQRLGFRVKVTDSIAAAQRFLMEPVCEPRLVLVDDPFGGAHAADDAAREIATLEHLLPLLANDRRLILAQAQDRLLEVTRKKTVASIETGGVRWVEISKLDGSFLASIWAQVCTTHSVPEWLSNRVRDVLVAKELELEPGCLIHLAVNHRLLADGAELDVIVRLAREDAHALGRALSKDGLRPLVSALAVSTTPDRPVSLVELAFAMGSGGPERPGESKVIGTMCTIGGAKPASGIAPKYEPSPVFSAATRELMDKLEVRRIVEGFANDMYTFTHPFYRASAESLLDSSTTSAERSAIALADRSLFSLSPLTADAAARNLAWLYERFDTESGRASIIRTAADGLKSIFPAVRDSCFGFLAKRLKQLPMELQTQVSEWVSAVTFFNVSNVEWIQGQPRIPSPSLGSVVEIDPFPRQVSEPEVRKTLQALDRQAPTSISPEEAARAVMFLEQFPDRMTRQVVGRLLSYDIALLRAPAAGAWLQRPRTDDDQVLERIFAEEHPAVAIAVLRAIIRAWWDCEPARRTQLKLGLLRMASSPVAAAALIDRLVLFGRREETGDDAPWELFEVLMPRIFSVLPPNTALHEARLYHVLDDAAKHIAVDSLLQIVDYWIDLLRDIVANRVLSDFMLGVTDVLISGTKDQPQKREGRIKTLLAIPGTGSRIRVVADCH